MKRIVIDKDSKGTIAVYWAVSLVLAALAILFIHPGILGRVRLFRSLVP